MPRACSRCARSVVQDIASDSYRRNLVGGLTFVGLTLYSTHYKTGPKRAVR